MIVGFPSHWGSLEVILAKLISGKPVIFDAFTSIYDSLVLDKQLVRKGSLKAWFYWFLDWLNCHLADKILLDTHEQIKYFIKTFRIRKDRFKRVFVGSDNEIFRPLKEFALNDQGKFICSFHGSFIPLHGVEYIVKAAKILEGKTDIQFEILGQGQTFKKVKCLVRDFGLKNITFFDRVSYKDLPNFIARTDIYLGGPFGNTPKAQRVIPNKVYEAIAMKKPVIVSNTPAINELFTNYKNCIMCNIIDEKDLAQKILEARNSPDLRKKIAQGGWDLFREKFTLKILGAELKEISNNLNNGHYKRLL